MAMYILLTMLLKVFCSKQDARYAFLKFKEDAFTEFLLQFSHQAYTVKL